MRRVGGCGELVSAIVDGVVEPAVKATFFFFVVRESFDNAEPTRFLGTAGARTGVFCMSNAVLATDEQIVDDCPSVDLADADRAVGNGVVLAVLLRSAIEVVVPLAFFRFIDGARAVATSE